MIFSRKIIILLLLIPIQSSSMDNKKRKSKDTIIKNKIAKRSSTRYASLEEVNKLLVQHNLLKNKIQKISESQTTIQTDIKHIKEALTTLQNTFNQNSQAIALRHIQENQAVFKDDLEEYMGVVKNLEAALPVLQETIMTLQEYSV